MFSISNLQNSMNTTENYRLHSNCYEFMSLTKNLTVGKKTIFRCDF